MTTPETEATVIDLLAALADRLHQRPALTLIRGDLTDDDRATQLANARAHLHLTDAEHYAMAQEQRAEARRDARTGGKS